MLVLVGLSFVCYKLKSQLRKFKSDQGDRDVYKVRGHAIHNYDICAFAHNHVHMAACMYTISWHAQAHISAKLGHIREIKVFML